MSWGRRKGEDKFEGEVSGEEAGKMVGLVTVPRTQERGQMHVGEAVKNTVWMHSGKGSRGASMGDTEH